MDDPETLVRACQQMAEGDALTRIQIPRLRHAILRPPASPGLEREMAPRLFVALRGVRRYRDWLAVDPDDLVLQPGEALFLVPGKCAGEVHAEVGEVLAMTLMPDCLRVARIVCSAPGAPTATASGSRHLAPLVVVPGPPGPQIDHITGSLALLRPEQVASVGVLLCRVLLQLVAERLGQRPDTAAGKAETTWLMLQAYLGENLAAPLSRETVGQALAIHPNHVSRLCRRFADATFTESLTLLRLQRAAHLLTHSRQTIAEIGYLCGFRDPSYFTVQFSALYGHTPSRWRARQLSPPPA